MLFHNKVFKIYNCRFDTYSVWHLLQHSCLYPQQAGSDDKTYFPHKAATGCKNKRNTISPLSHQKMSVCAESSFSQGNSWCLFSKMRFLPLFKTEKVHHLLKKLIVSDKTKCKLCWMNVAHYNFNILLPGTCLQHGWLLVLGNYQLK